jgi:hypothetical protein
MKNFFLLIMLSLILMACDRQDKPTNTTPSGQDYDNTGKNIRDRDSVTKTPLDQKAGKGASIANCCRRVVHKWSTDLDRAFG